MADNFVTVVSGRSTEGVIGEGDGERSTTFILSLGYKLRVSVSLRVCKTERKYL